MDRRRRGKWDVSRLGCVFENDGPAPAREEGNTTPSSKIARDGPAPERVEDTSCGVRRPEC